MPAGCDELYHILNFDQRRSHALNALQNDPSRRLGLGYLSVDDLELAVLFSQHVSLFLDLAAHFLHPSTHAIGLPLHELLEALQTRGQGGIVHPSSFAVASGQLILPGRQIARDESY